MPGLWSELLTRPDLLFSDLVWSGPQATEAATVTSRAATSRLDTVESALAALRAEMAAALAGGAAGANLSVSGGMQDSSLPQRHRSILASRSRASLTNTPEGGAGAGALGLPPLPPGGAGAGAGPGGPPPVSASGDTPPWSSQAAARPRVGFGAAAELEDTKASTCAGCGGVCWRVRAAKPSLCTIHTHTPDSGPFPLVLSSTHTCLIHPLEPLSCCPNYPTPASQVVYFGMGVYPGHYTTTTNTTTTTTTTTTNTNTNTTTHHTQASVADLEAKLSELSRADKARDAAVAALSAQVDEVTRRLGDLDTRVTDAAMEAAAAQAAAAAAAAAGGGAAGGGNAGAAAEYEYEESADSYGVSEVGRRPGGGAAGGGGGGGGGASAADLERLNGELQARLKAAVKVLEGRVAADREVAAAGIGELGKGLGVLKQKSVLIDEVIIKLARRLDKLFRRVQVRGG